MSRYQKGKTNLDLLEQETVSGSGISSLSLQSSAAEQVLDILMDILLDILMDILSWEIAEVVSPCLPHGL